eukprot:5599025-Alexandrium_andersonii.AAC.1
MAHARSKNTRAKGMVTPTPLLISIARRRPPRAELRAPATSKSNRSWHCQHRSHTSDEPANICQAG